VYEQLDSRGSWNLLNVVLHESQLGSSRKICCISRDDLKNSSFLQNRNLRLFLRRIVDMSSFRETSFAEPQSFRKKTSLD
jgi:hypothetical protein